MVNGPTLEVNLAALVHNYRVLAGQHAHGYCAAVVKANAYGLGVGPVSAALREAGCREFFVASLAEGIELRKHFSADTEKAAPAIYVFHGVRKGEMADFIEHQLVPVLNDRGQWEHWVKGAPCALHVDTGMCRLGVTLEELIALQPSERNLELIISHLACANEPGHPQNHQQLKAFQAARERFPSVAASLANSSGIFLGKEYHADLLRPGCALYGISPNPLLPNPVAHVATLTAPVLQLRTISSPQPVGYGGMGRAQAGQVLATVELGYADGFQRALSNVAYGYAHGVRLPVIGRVSMDMVSVDITALPLRHHTPDLRIAFICEQQPVDVLAEMAGTIGYEIFTGMGRRVRRSYVGSA